MVRAPGPDSEIQTLAENRCPATTHIVAIHPLPHVCVERGEKTPALLRKRPVLLRANFFLTKDRKRPYYGHFCGKIHREGSSSKAARGLSKVQMLNLVLGLGVFSLTPRLWLPDQDILACVSWFIFTGALGLRSPAPRTKYETLLSGPISYQQFTYGVVSEGVFAESLRKFCGKFAEICKEMRFIAPGKGVEILRKVCGNFAEICGKFSAMTPSRTTP